MEILPGDVVLVIRDAIVVAKVDAVACEGCGTGHLLFVVRRWLQGARLVEMVRCIGCDPGGAALEESYAGT